MKKLWIGTLASLLAACATTSGDAARNVKVAGPKVEQQQAAPSEGGQPLINAHAKLLFDDANKAAEAQKKQGKADYAALKPKYRAALDADQNLAEAEYDLGVIAERQGNKDEAVAHYQAALAKKPTLKEAAENLGVIAQNAGNQADAVKVYQGILDHYPDDASSRARLAEIMREQHNVDQALDLAKQALVRDPKSVPAYKVMLLCYLEQKQLALAKLIALRTIKLSENDPELYHAMGMILAQEKEPEKALLQFKKALEVRPDYMPARMLLAKAAMDKENFGEAEEHLRRILQVDSKNCAAHIDLAVAYKGMGQPDKAMQEYDVAEKLCPDTPAIYLNRGIILHRMKNQPAAAIELYNKYIAMTGANLPSDHPVKNLLQEAQQLIEADKQAKAAEEQAKKMEAEQKANEEKAKADEAAKKKEAAKPGAEGAAGEGADAKAAPAGGAEKPAGKAGAKPAKGEAKGAEPKGDAKPASAPPPASNAKAEPDTAKPAPAKVAPPAKAAPAKQDKPTGDEPTDEPN